MAALLCYSLTASAQTYIKTNALYWVGLLPNVQVETNLGAGFTFQGEINASLWESIDNKPFMGSQFIVGARWYPKSAFKGFYVGGGWHLGKYWGENIAPDGTSRMYASWNASGNAI